MEVLQLPDRTWKGYLYPSDMQPRRESEPFTIREDAERWVREAVRGHWKTPARKVYDYGQPIPTGRQPYCEHFDYGTGHGVSNWSPAKWEAVHKLQKQYLRETAQVWKDATAGAEGYFDKLRELDQARRATRVPNPVKRGALTSGRAAVREYQERASKEFFELERTAPAGLEVLRKTLREAAERRDKLIANLGEI